MEEIKANAEIQKLSIENHVAIMREVKKLQSESFTDKEILGMIPKSKGMLETQKEIYLIH